MFGAELAIRPDSLQRAGALGELHRLLAMDVEDAEGLEEGAEGEDNTRGNGHRVDLDWLFDRGGNSGFKTYFCNCQQYLCLFHIVFECIPNIHD